MALPVESSVSNIGNLRWQVWVYIECVDHKTETKIAENGNAIGPTHTSQEREGWMSPTIGLVVVNELLGVLEPRRSNVRFSAIQIVRVCRASGRGYLVGNNTVNTICHARPVQRLLSGVVVEIRKRVRIGIVQEVINKYHIRLFHTDSPVHGIILQNDICVVVNRNKYILALVCPGIIDRQSKSTTENISCLKVRLDESIGESRVVDIVGIFILLSVNFESICELNNTYRVRCVQ